VKDFKKEITLSLISLLLCYLALVIIDYNFLFKNSGIIYKPYTKEQWSRMEFNYNISINSLGIRDDELIDKNYSYLIGDSMVFGEGLSLNETISKRLSKLCNKDYINLGMSGGNIKDYINIYKKSKEKIKEENTIVILFLGNDIMDYSNVKNTTELEKIFNSLKLRNTRTILKNLIKKPNLDCDELPKNPKELNNLEYNNYLNLDKSIYDMSVEDKPCHQLKINPYLVHSALENKDSLIQFYNGKNIEQTKIKIKELNKEIKNITIIFIPDVSHLNNTNKTLYTQLKMEFPSWGDIEKTYQDLDYFCKLENIRCLDLRNVFLNNTNLFYHFDPHLNSLGSELAAREISRSVC